MSPEQCGGGGSVDTRTDVHALGALGCELLTGELPYPVRDVQEPWEALRIIRQEDPRRARQLAAGLARDLDAILAKALEKDPERRYATAAALADDLERWLEQRPVEAREGGVLYVARRFTARHRALAATLAVTFLGAALSAAGLAHGAAADARAVGALGALRQALVLGNAPSPYLLPEASRDQARRELTRGLGATLEEIERRYGTGRAELVVVLDTIGLVLLGFGDAHGALRFLERALDLELVEHGPDHPETLTSMHNLALALALAGRDVEAELLYRRAIDGRARALGAENLDTAATRYNLGLLLLRAGRAAEAEAELRAVRTTRAALLGELDRATLQAGSDLAMALWRLGRREESLELDRAVLEGRIAALGELDADTLVSRNNLIEGVRESGNAAEASELATILLDALRRSRPEPSLACMALMTLGNALHGESRFDDAERLFREALALAAWTSGWDEPDALAARTNLGAVLLDTGRPEEAIPDLEAVVVAYARSGWAPDALPAKQNLAACYHDAGRFEEAQELFRHVYEARRESLGPGNWLTLGTLAGLASALAASGETEEGLALVDEALASDEYRGNWTRLDVLDARATRADIKCRYRDGETAVELFTALVADARENLADEHPLLGRIELGFGRCLLAAGELDGAERRLSEAWRSLRPGSVHWRAASSDLLEVLERTGERERAAALRFVLDACAAR